MTDTSIPALYKKCANPQCEHAGEPQPVSAFYVRSGNTHPTIPGHYLSECKACMHRRTKEAVHLPADEPRAWTEKIAINYLRSRGIPCLPGKAVSAADVDVVAWGCVWIEVKYAKLVWRRGSMEYKFDTTVKQQQRGFLAQVVLLICEDDNEARTFHLFKADDPVFYIRGHIKSGLCFVPGTMAATKHRNTRVVMTQPMMDAAENRIRLIVDTRIEIERALAEANQQYAPKSLI